MEKNEELQKKARDGEMALKGTVVPDITTEPVAPVRAAGSSIRDQPGVTSTIRFAQHRDPGDETDVED